MDVAKLEITRTENDRRQQMTAYHPHYKRTYPHAPLIKKWHVTSSSHCFTCGATIRPKSAKGSYVEWQKHNYKHHR